MRFNRQPRAGYKYWVLWWVTFCDHAAAVPAVLRVLCASGSVPRQKVGHSSCMQILVRTVHNCAADRGISQYSSGDVVDAPVVVQ